MANVVQNLFDAVNVITEEKLKGLNFNITIECTINNIELRTYGQYMVTDGSTSFSAYSENTNYEIGDRVYVLVPNGNYEKQKIILRKITDDATVDADNSQNNLYNNYISVIDGIFSRGIKKDYDSNQEDYTLIANNSKEKEKVLWSFNEPIDLSYCSLLKITADFKTKFDDYDILAGTYGLRFDIITEPEKNRYKYYSITFDTDSMFGNYYAFHTFKNQFFIMDVAKILQSKESIYGMQLVFFQGNNFTTYKNSISEGAEPIVEAVPVASAPNLFVSNIKLSFGINANNIHSDRLYLNSLSPLTYSSDVDETNNNTDIRNIHKKNMELKWVHVNKNSQEIEIIDTLEELIKTEQAEIHWFRKNANANSFLGQGWEELVEVKNEFEYKDFIPEFELSSETIKALIETPGQDYILSLKNKDKRFEIYKNLLKEAQAAVQSNTVKTENSNVINFTHLLEQIDNYTGETKINAFNSFIASLQGNSLLKSFLTSDTYKGEKYKTIFEEKFLPAVEQIPHLQELIENYQKYIKEFENFYFNINTYFGDIQEYLCPDDLNKNDFAKNILATLYNNEDNTQDVNQPTNMDIQTISNDIGLIPKMVKTYQEIYSIINQYFGIFSDYRTSLGAANEQSTFYKTLFSFASAEDSKIVANSDINSWAHPKLYNDYYSTKDNWTDIPMFLNMRSDEPISLTQRGEEYFIQNLNANACYSYGEDLAVNPSIQKFKLIGSFYYPYNEFNKRVLRDNNNELIPYNEIGDIALYGNSNMTELYRFNNNNELCKYTTTNGSKIIYKYSAELETDSASNYTALFREENGGNVLNTNIKEEKVNVTNDLTLWERRFVTIENINELNEVIETVEIRWIEHKFLKDNLLKTLNNTSKFFESNGKVGIHFTYMDNGVEVLYETLLGENRLSTTSNFITDGSVTDEDIYHQNYVINLNISPSLDSNFSGTYTEKIKIINDVLMNISINNFNLLTNNTSALLKNFEINPLADLDWFLSYTGLNTFDTNFLLEKDVAIEVVNANTITMDSVIADKTSLNDIDTPGNITTYRDVQNALDDLEKQYEIETQKIISNEIIFTNKNKKDIDINDNIAKLSCDNEGKFSLYKPDGYIKNIADTTEIRKVELQLLGMEQQVLPIDKITWIIPTSNTMIVYPEDGITYFTSKGDVLKEDNNNIYITREKPQAPYIQNFRIKEYYNKKFANNSIICQYLQNGISYTLSLNLQFEVDGNSGTNYSLFLNFDNYDKALTLGKDMNAVVVPHVFDPNGNEITTQIDKNNFHYTWYSGKKVSLSDATSQYSLILTPNMGRKESEFSSTDSTLETTINRQGVLTNNIIDNDTKNTANPHDRKCLISINPKYIYDLEKLLEQSQGTADSFNYLSLDMKDFEYYILKCTVNNIHAVTGLTAPGENAGDKEETTRREENTDGSYTIITSKIIQQKDEDDEEKIVEYRKVITTRYNADGSLFGERENETSNKYKYIDDSNQEVENPLEKLENLDENKNDASADKQISLIAYLPIPVRLADEIFSYNGPTTIAYDSSGVNPEYYNGGSSLEYDNMFAALYNINDKVSWKISLGSDTGTGNNASRYYPQIHSTTGVLTPLSMYMQGNGREVAIQGYIDGILVWTQPLRIYQNQYSSVLLNSWDGNLTFDEENGIILSTMIGAGKKDSNNRFNGVLMGDVSLASESFGNEDGSNGAYNKLKDYYCGIGLYGYSEGCKSFGFNINGRAFLGRSGRGQILFDGNSGVIQSANYMLYNQGMFIDLDKGILSSRGVNTITTTDEGTFRTYSEVRIDPNPGIDESDPYFLIQNNQGIRLMSISNQDYYLQTSNFTQANNFVDIMYSVESIMDEEEITKIVGIKVNQIGKDNKVIKTEEWRYDKGNNNSSSFTIVSLLTAEEGTEESFEETSDSIENFNTNTETSYQVLYENQVVCIYTVNVTTDNEDNITRLLGEISSVVDYIYVPTIQNLSSNDVSSAGTKIDLQTGAITSYDFSINALITQDRKETIFGKDTTNSFSFNLDSNLSEVISIKQIDEDNKAFSLFSVDWTGKGYFNTGKVKHTLQVGKYWTLTDYALYGYDVFKGLAGLGEANNLNIAGGLFFFPGGIKPNICTDGTYEALIFNEADSPKPRNSKYAKTKIFVGDMAFQKIPDTTGYYYQEKIDKMYGRAWIRHDGIIMATHYVCLNNEIRLNAQWKQDEKTWKLDKYKPVKLSTLMDGAHQDYLVLACSKSHGFKETLSPKEQVVV